MAPLSGNSETNKGSGMSQPDKILKSEYVKLDAIAAQRVRKYSASCGLQVLPLEQSISPENSLDKIDDREESAT